MQSCGKEIGNARLGVMNVLWVCGVGRGDGVGDYH